MKLALAGIVGLVVAAGLALSCEDSLGDMGSDGSDVGARPPDAAQAESDGSDGGPRSPDAAQAESRRDAAGTSAGVVCPAGRVCAAALCNGSTCSACVEASCGVEPDGTPCAIPTDAGGNTGAVHAEYNTGICCNHQCGDPRTDNRNCGGCGVTCCSGKQCSGMSGLIAAECF